MSLPLLSLVFLTAVAGIVLIPVLSFHGHLLLYWRRYLCHWSRTPEGRSEKLVQRLIYDATRPLLVKWLFGAVGSALALAGITLAFALAWGPVVGLAFALGMGVLFRLRRFEDRRDALRFWTESAESVLTSLREIAEGRG